jgi:hypothetical protein
MVTRQAERRPPKKSPAEAGQDTKRVENTPAQQTPTVLYRLSYGITSSFAHASHCRRLASNSAHADSRNGARPGCKKLLPLLGGKDLAAIELQ